MNCFSRNIFLLSAIGLLISACGGSADSEDIRTPGIRAEIKITANGNGRSNVSADLEVGSSGGLGATDLNLSGGDSLTATSDSITKPLLRETDFLGEITYENSFDNDASGTLFTVSFERSGDTSAPNSWVELPDYLNVSLPEENQVFDLGDNINLTWEASFTSDEFQVETNSACPITGGTSYSGSSFTTVDDGSFTISAQDALGLASDESPAQSLCDVQIVFRRVNNGYLDPNYGEGGKIEGIQKRTVNINILL